MGIAKRSRINVRRSGIEERNMQIVGTERTDCHGGVDTIDIWYSARRKAWLVERLDADGHQVGFTHRCETEDEAAACLTVWLRAHGETHLVAPRDTTAAERRVLQRETRKQAA